MFVIKLIFVMGCGWGYRFYRSDEQRECPVRLFFCIILVYSVCVYVFVFFWGYFGVGSGTHYMYFL